MGAITAEDEARYQDLGYDTSLGGEDVGRAGIELSYETQLHGQWGEVVYEVDAANRIVREISRTEPVNGMDLQLSIDLDLQQYAERLLQTQLRHLARRRAPRTRRSPSPTAPAARSTRAWPSARASSTRRRPARSTVMNYQTGQIMAMASYPTFDNRWFSADIDDEKFERDLPDHGTRRWPPRPRPGAARQPGDPGPVQPRLDVQGVHRLRRPRHRADQRRHARTTTQGTYELQRASIAARQVRHAACPLRVPQLVLRAAATGPCRYGTINVMQSLAVSSDAFFYKLGEEFYNTPGTQLQDHVRLFGFGADTGVDLPYEFDGRVPTNELKAAAHRERRARARTRPTPCSPATCC